MDNSTGRPSLRGDKISWPTCMPYLPVTNFLWTSKLNGDNSIFPVVVKLLFLSLTYLCCGQKIQNWTRYIPVPNSLAGLVFTETDASFHLSWSHLTVNRIHHLVGLLPIRICGGFSPPFSDVNNLNTSRSFFAHRRRLRSSPDEFFVHTFRLIWPSSDLRLCRFCCLVQHNHKPIPRQVPWSTWNFEKWSVVQVFSCMNYIDQQTSCSSCELLYSSQGQTY